MMDNQSIYYFEQGIPGFEQYQHFLMNELEAELPLRIMQVVQEEISLVLTSPFAIYPEYEWILSEASKKELQIESEEDVEVWSVLTIPSDPNAATINLIAPIVLNRTKKLGKQIILHDSGYSSKAPINRI